MILRGRGAIWWGWRVVLVAPHILNDASNVSGINHESHFSWQARAIRWSCSVIFHGKRNVRRSCSVTFRGRRSIWWSYAVSLAVTGALFGNVGAWLLVAGAVLADFSWRSQHVVMSEHDFSWVLLILQGHFSWSAQYLVILRCHFSGQAQHLVISEREFSWQAHYLLILQCPFSIRRNLGRQPEHKML